MDRYEIEVPPAELGDACSEPGADDADAGRGRHSPTVPGAKSAGASVAPRCRWEMKKWPRGPMLKAKSTVPTPTLPPRTHPTARAVSSSRVRTAHSGNPLAAMPVIRPSRGPG